MRALMIDTAESRKMACPHASISGCYEIAIDEIGRRRAEIEVAEDSSLKTCFPLHSRLSEIRAVEGNSFTKTDSGIVISINIVSDIVAICGGEMRPPRIGQ